MKLLDLIKRMPNNTQCSIRIRFELWSYEKVLDFRNVKLSKLKMFSDFEVGNIIAVGDNKIKLSVYSNMILEEEDLKKYDTEKIR